MHLPFFVLRGLDFSTPWRASYEEAYQQLSRRLNIVQPVMPAILNLWDGQSSLVLVDLSRGRDRGPVDVEHWKNNVALEVEKAEERLINSWYPRVIALFSGEGKVVEGVRAQQQESFYECVTTLISNHVSTDQPMACTPGIVPSLHAATRPPDPHH